jgi:DNA recombination protein RmuC
LLIPNEQVYAFIHATDPALVDEAMAQRVILCSPVGLIGVLAVIRQAADSFAIQRAARDVLDLLTSFKKQWDKFQEGLQRLGGRLDAAHKDYDELTGPRRRQIDKVLLKIDDLREERMLALPEPAVPEVEGEAEAGDDPADEGDGAADEGDEAPLF